MAWRYDDALGRRHAKPAGAGVSDRGALGQPRRIAKNDCKTGRPGLGCGVELLSELAAISSPGSRAQAASRARPPPLVVGVVLGRCSAPARRLLRAGAPDSAVADVFLFTPDLHALHGSSLGLAEEQAMPSPIDAPCRVRTPCARFLATAAALDSRLVFRFQGDAAQASRLARLVLLGAEISAAPSPRVVSPACR